MGDAQRDGSIGLDVLPPRCTSTRVVSLGDPFVPYLSA